MCVGVTCTPTEKRLTPADTKSRRAVLPAGAGFTSSVTSAFSQSRACAETVSRMAATVEARARLGVPPPKNTELILT